MNTPSRYSAQFLLYWDYTHAYIYIARGLLSEAWSKGFPLWRTASARGVFSIGRGDGLSKASSFSSNRNKMKLPTAPASWLAICSISGRCLRSSGSIDVSGQSVDRQEQLRESLARTSAVRVEHISCRLRHSERRLQISQLPASIILNSMVHELCTHAYTI